MVAGSSPVRLASKAPAIAGAFLVFAGGLARAGATVHLEGTILRHLGEDRSRLRDAIGTIRVPVSLPEGITVAAGDRVREEDPVHDPRRFGLARPEIHATAIVPANGERLEVPPPPDGAAWAPAASAR